MTDLFFHTLTNLTIYNADRGNIETDMEESNDEHDFKCNNADGHECDPQDPPMMQDRHDDLNEV